MMKRLFYGVFILFPLVFGASVLAAEMFPPASMVRQRCAACHKPDPKGRLDVIEETRKSPEEWKHVVTRMIRLNSAPILDADFYPIIKELSSGLCLTPNEMSQVAYYNSDENSQYREIPQDEEETRLYTACVRCHTYAKVVSHRMTEDQWRATRDLHLGYYPTVVPQMREMDWVKESDELVPILTKKFPYQTPEWEQWIQEKKDPDLSGNWMTAGYQPGMGYYTGDYAFTPDGDKGKDEYLVERTVRYLNGMTLTMRGTGTLYGAYHLRIAMAPTPLTGRIEGVFDLNANTMGFTGKWWTTIQDTNAYGNETFFKADGSPRVMAAFPNALQADDAAEQTLTIAGVGMPDKLAPTDIGFSNEGIKVASVSVTDSGTAVCTLRVSKDVPVGPVTLTMKGTAYENPILIYDKIDGIQILPRLGRARVSSGAAYPPQGVQFIARAVHYGADGKPDTADDLILEPVDAEWRLTEEVTREGDDDLKYLKAPVAGGLYTPVTTYGPIEERAQRREGVGLIAVVAEYGGFEAKAKLAVTVPDFIPNIK